MGAGASAAIPRGGSGGGARRVGVLQFVDQAAINRTSAGRARPAAPNPVRLAGNGPRSGWHHRNHRKVRRKGRSRPVSRILFRREPGGGGHSSRARVAARLQRAYPEVWAGPASPALAGGLPPYSLLHRVGFAVPPRSPGARCALTAPFHPCHAHPRGCRSAVCSLWHFPAGHPDRPLAGTLSCGVRTFLGGPILPSRRVRPDDSGTGGSSTRTPARQRERRAARRGALRLTAGGPAALPASRRGPPRRTASRPAPGRCRSAVRATRGAGAPSPSAPRARASSSPAPRGSDPPRA